MRRRRFDPPGGLRHAATQRWHVRARGRYSTLTWLPSTLASLMGTVEVVEVKFRRDSAVSILQRKCPAGSIWCRSGSPKSAAVVLGCAPFILPASSNGRTEDFDSSDRGSNPCAGTLSILSR